MSLNMISSRSIHLASSGVTSLFFIAEKYSIVYMKHSFIHSSVDEHLHCLRVLAVVNSAAVRVGVHVSFGIMIFSGIAYISWNCVQ